MNEGTREKEQVIDPRMDEIIPQTVLFFFFSTWGYFFNGLSIHKVILPSSL